MLQEIFLDVVGFVDYATLVLLKLPNQSLLGFVDRHAKKLAIRRAFWLQCDADKFKVYNANEWWCDTPVVVTVDANDTDRIAALAELKAIIGSNFVDRTHFYEPKILVRSLLDAIPRVRDTFDVYVDGPPSTAERYVEDIREFRGPEWLNLDQMPLDGLLALMKHDCTSKVTWLSATPAANEPKDVVGTDAVSEILRFCMDLDHLRELETKRIRLEYWSFGWTFVERLIEALTQSKRLRTVTISTPEGLTKGTVEMGNGFQVYYWELPLSDVFSETQSVAIDEFLRFGFRWLKLAHFSRQTNVAVFVSEDLLTVTNNAKHVEYEMNHLRKQY